MVNWGAMHAEVGADATVWDQNTISTDTAEVDSIYDRARQCHSVEELQDMVGELYGRLLQQNDVIL